MAFYIESTEWFGVLHLPPSFRLEFRWTGLDFQWNSGTSVGIPLDFHQTFPPICEDWTPVEFRFMSSSCPVHVQLASSTTQSSVRWTEMSYRTGLEHQTHNWKKSIGTTGHKSTGLHETTRCKSPGLQWTNRTPLTHAEARCAASYFQRKYVGNMLEIFPLYFQP